MNTNRAKLIMSDEHWDLYNYKGGLILISATGESMLVTTKLSSKVTVGLAKELLLADAEEQLENSVLEKEKEKLMKSIKEKQTELLELEHQLLQLDK